MYALPASVTLGPIAFTPIAPTFSQLVTFRRAFLSAETDEEQTDVALAALAMVAPPAQRAVWAPPRGATTRDTIAALGARVGLWCGSNGVLPMEAWRVADECAAALIELTNPPPMEAAKELAGFSAPPTGGPSDGASTSLGSTLATPSAG